MFNAATQERPWWSGHRRDLSPAMPVPGADLSSAPLSMASKVLFPAKPFFPRNLS